MTIDDGLEIVGNGVNILYVFILRVKYIMDDNYNGVCDYSGHRWGYEKKVLRMANEANALGPL